MQFQAIPYRLYTTEGQETRFWVHYGLVILGFLLAVITLIAQWLKPAPYGKHEEQNANWGPAIPQRLGHTLSDAIPGVLVFSLVFFLYGSASLRGYASYTFYALFLLHYLHRGILHPLVMRYRSAKVAVGIVLGGFFPNCLFHFLNSDFIGSADFQDNYLYDPRFICGILLYVVGFIINRWADLKLRSLRNTKGVLGCTGYYIPYGGLFELISCPNYFGELLQWTGWTIMTWSMAGLVWCLFSAATFIPRSCHNHQWYKSQFENYPPNRKALIPYIF